MTRNWLQAQKLQSTCSKKFKKILDENKSLKSELSEIKTLLWESLKRMGIFYPINSRIISKGTSCNCGEEDHTASNYTSIRCNKPYFVCGSFEYYAIQCAKLTVLLVLLVLNENQDPGATLVVVYQGHTNRVVLDSDPSLSLLFHDHDKLLFDIHASAFEEKKRRAEEGKNAKGHSDDKEEAAEERVIGLGPPNIEEIRQARNQEKNVGTEDLLPFPLVEEFSKSSPYSKLHDFGGSKVDEDNIDETKNCGDVDSIINNVISCVFVASSSLPTSPDVKNTQAERSELGGINNDTTDVIFDVDATTKFVNVDQQLVLLRYLVLFILSQHLDTIFYYMRKKAKYEPNIVVKFTTTNFVFSNKIDALYHDFVENGKDFSSIPEKHEVGEYVRGFYCDANRPWNKVDYVLFPVYVPWEKSELGHWISGVFDFTDWCIYVYDSNRISDCGAFLCAFAEYVIHGRDIPKEIDIGHVLIRYGALWWDYEKRKLEAGIKDNTTEKVGRLFGKEKRMRTHQE
ncbi:hypothetical protein FXO37_02162 [Capsicum annuum]|nr:hypothetical protein FXO37_02162 [Capsicum annuum]